MQIRLNLILAVVANAAAATSGTCPSPTETARAGAPPFAGAGPGLPGAEWRRQCSAPWRALPSCYS